MSDETRTTETPKAKQAPKAAQPAQPAQRAFPDNARITPQPKQRPKHPKMDAPVPREGTVEPHLHAQNVEGKPVPAWKHAAAKAMNRCPHGAELSREMYDKAIEAAGNVTIS